MIDWLQYGDIEWGDVPGWIEALGTTLAFGAVAWTLALALRDRRAQQAAEVDYHVWAARRSASRESPPSEVPLGLDPKDYGRIWLTVRNNSSNPVNELTLLMPFADPNTRPLRTVPPGNYTIAFDRLCDEAYEGDSLATLIPRIQFRDRRGRVWQRSANGNLERVTKRNKNYLLPGTSL